jgi:hypothetical protein
MQLIVGILMIAVGVLLLYFTVRGRANTIWSDVSTPKPGTTPGGRLLPKYHSPGEKAV